MQKIFKDRFAEITSVIKQKIKNRKKKIILKELTSFN